MENIQRLCGDKIREKAHRTWKRADKGAADIPGTEYQVREKKLDRIETQFITQRAGDIEIRSIKENSYDLLNTIMAIKGYIDNLEYSYLDKELPIPVEEREKISKIKQRLAHAQKLLQDRIESIG